MNAQPQHPHYAQQPQAVPVPGNPYAMPYPPQAYPAPTGVLAPPAAPVYAHQMRRQSLRTHLVLAVTTAGLGNILYSRWAKSKVAANYQW
jgi:hypothetical protein